MKEISLRTKVAHKIASGISKEPVPLPGERPIPLGQIFSGQEPTGTAGVMRNRSEKSPPAPAQLGVASYNVHMGGKDVTKIAGELQQANPDVACLQEVSRKTATAVADALGLNYAWTQIPGKKHQILGKAVLSRFPLKNAKLMRYDISKEEYREAYERAKAAGKKFAHSLLQQRTILEATVLVGDKPLRILNIHNSVSDGQMTARQLGQLHRYVRELEGKGHNVIVAGDANMDMNAVRGGVNAPGTTTDTPEERMERYGKKAGDAARHGQKEGRAFLADRVSFWDPGHERVYYRNDRTIIPEEAAAELAKQPPGEPVKKQLQHAVDGVTHVGGSSQIDVLLANKGKFQIERAALYDSDAFDHNLVAAVLSQRAED